MEREHSLVLVGRIAGPHGVKGWLRVSSYTDPETNLFDYAPWVLRDRGRDELSTAAPIVEKQRHGKGWIARFDGIDDRDHADELKGCEILVPRDRLPDPGEGRYYWADLEGLQVKATAGDELGIVDHLLAVGDTDMLVVRDPVSGARRMVPFVRGETVREVDFAAGCIVVDWQVDD